MEEMSVEEFKAKGLKISKSKKPDLTYARFVSAIGAFCIERHYDLPTREFRFHPTRKWRFDLAWVYLLTALEYEGGTWVPGESRHTSPRGYRNDAEKYSEAAIRGWCVIRVTSDMVKDGTALDLLARALAEGSARQGGSECLAPHSSTAARPIPTPTPGRPRTRSTRRTSPAARSR